MKKYWSLLLFFPFLIFSCIEDESEYTMQEKERVEVDQFEIDSISTDEELPEGQLVPGLHTVTLRVLQGVDSVDRQFKYYMPVSTNASLPISLIFEFHGSYEFDSPAKIVMVESPNVSEGNETVVASKTFPSVKGPKFETITPKITLINTKGGSGFPPRQGRFSLAKAPVCRACPPL